MCVTVCKDMSRSILFLVVCSDPMNIKRILNEVDQACVIIVMSLMYLFILWCSDWR